MAHRKWTPPPRHYAATSSLKPQACSLQPPASSLLLRRPRADVGDVAVFVVVRVLELHVAHVLQLGGAGLGLLRSEGGTFFSLSLRPSFTLSLLPSLRRANIAA